MSRSYENGPEHDNRQIENKKCDFKIPSYGQLKMLFLFFDVQATGDVTGLNALNFPDYIELLDNNQIIGKTSSEDLFSMIDRLDQNQSNIIIAGSSGSGQITTTLQTVSIPLLFWPTNKQLINTNGRNLTLRYKGKDNVTEMGLVNLTGTVSLMDMRIRCVYDNKEKVELDLSKSYNSFQFPGELITYAGSDNKTVKTLLNVNVAVYNVCFIIKGNFIKSVTLLYPNGNEETHHNYSDYTQNSIVGNTGLGYVFNVPFNDYFMDETQLMNISKAPVRATIVTSTSALNNTMHIVYNYKSKIVEMEDTSLGVKFLMEENNLLY